jgi:uncharacterized membrane protein YhaH (DUF805 family)
MNLVQLFFGFSGRINRAKYWLAVIVYIATTAIVLSIEFALSMSRAFLILALVVCIPVAISGVAVSIKRLHDRDKSGWWLLVFYGLPGVLSGIAETMGPYFIFELASAAVSIWAIVELGFLPGTFRANRYGPDPLAS